MFLSFVYICTLLLWLFLLLLVRCIYTSIVFYSIYKVLNLIICTSIVLMLLSFTFTFSPGFTLFQEVLIFFNISFIYFQFIFYTYIFACIVLSAFYYLFFTLFFIFILCKFLHIK